MNDFQILTAIRNSGGSIDFTKLMDVGLADPVFDPKSDKQRIQYLISQECITGKTKAYSRISMLPKGTVLLDSLNQQHENADKQAKEDTLKERKQVRISFAQLFLGSAITLGIELILFLIAA